MTDPTQARAALRPIVADWFDTGYENGNLETDVLTDRILAALAALPDDGREGLAAALLDVVEEAIGSESLPANIHGRLLLAYNAVIEEADR